MNEVAGSVLIRRHIGRRFAALRRGVKLSQEEAARRLERSRATIARIEEGDPSIRFRDIDVRQMLDLYAAPDGDRTLLLALAAETRTGPRKSWWHDYTETELPPWFQLYVTMESSAAVIREYGHELLPGLLQTRRYAEKLMEPAGMAGDIVAAEIEQRVEVRMARQAVLTRPRAPHLEVIISEAALSRLRSAGQLGMEQLEHLMSVTQQGNVSVRIVPLEIGLHAGMAASNAFTLFEFPDDPLTGHPLEPPLAYIESFTGAMYLTKSIEVAAYTRVWHHMEATALDHTESRSRINAYREGLPR